MTYGQWLVAVGLTLGCGAEQQARELSNLDVTRLSLTGGFDVETPDAAQIMAALSYTRVGDECPSLPIAADLDDVALTPAPNGSGRVGGACQVGFFLETPIRDTAELSTLTFRDETGEVSFSVDSLLASHALLTAVEADATLRSGVNVRFGWSVESDTLKGADAYFKRGSKTIKAEARRAGNDVHVAVPELEPGDWRLELGAIADARVTGCPQATECVATIAGNGALSFKVAVAP